MGKILSQEVTNKNTWEKFVLSYNGANFLQSYNFGDFHQKLGKKIYRVGFFENEQSSQTLSTKKLIGVMLCIVERAKRATYLTVPGGPLIDWDNKQQVRLFKDTLEKIARQEKCSFIRCRPQIESNEKNKKLFAKLGFKNAPMHLHAELTHQLDLDKSEDLLLAGMRKTTRHEIKKAVNLGIKIKVSSNPHDIDDFYKLQKQTAQRQGFVEFNKRFLEQQFEIFAKDNQVFLYTAFFDKKKLAQAFVIFYGNEADYHYGASSPEGRNYPGASLIQWEAIREAKKRNLKRYNFWGVAPEGEKNHRFYGVSIFKRGFGGVDFEYLHAQDMIINHLRYRLNWFIETIRKSVRKV
ncbi:MAG: peptidoglycan bridge formation glycyltransferase FemA/FemB family protein [Candidatus Daviesbacteria bacterium]|nr:peptidoglycan bridge formation glycyltransferase FemA/FemB family protein [Candidatus Daviesbacteria bacterium]